MRPKQNPPDENVKRAVRQKPAYQNSTAAATLVIVVAAIAATIATTVATAIAAARVMVTHHHILGRSLAHLDDPARKLERLAGLG